MDAKLSQGRAAEAVARAARLSTRTLERAVKIIEGAPEGLKEKVA
jgi:transcriptional regulator GlxA family with amidase domain